MIFFVACLSLLVIIYHCLSKENPSHNTKLTRKHSRNYWFFNVFVLVNFTDTPIILFDNKLLQRTTFAIYLNIFKIPICYLVSNFVPEYSFMFHLVARNVSDTSHEWNLCESAEKKKIFILIRAIRKTT